MMHNSHHPSSRHTTPMTNRMLRHSFVRSLLATSFVVTIIVSSLYYFGSPALRTYYTYTGTWKYPTYHECHYLSLNGWQEYRPLIGFEKCPLVMLVPIKISFSKGNE